jgi:hypothetical protein
VRGIDVVTPETIAPDAVPLESKFPLAFVASYADALKTSLPTGTFGIVIEVVPGPTLLTNGAIVEATPLTLTSVIFTDAVAEEIYFGLRELLDAATFAGIVMVNFALDVTEGTAATGVATDAIG